MRVEVAKGEPIELFNGFRSFQTVAEARKLRADDLGSWKIVEDTPTIDGSGRILFRTVTAEIPGYLHDGQKGRLVLQFLNDRLTRVLFYPEDPDAYLAVLQRNGILVTRNATWSNRLDLSAKAQPAALESFSYSDVRGARYVAWVDTRLDAEYHHWVTAYK